jgi:hypothetical protein
VSLKQLLVAHEGKVLLIKSAFTFVTKFHGYFLQFLLMGTCCKTHVSHKSMHILLSDAVTKILNKPYIPNANCHTIQASTFSVSSSQ